jgi:hypothetical protein
MKRLVVRIMLALGSLPSPARLDDESYVATGGNRMNHGHRPGVAMVLALLALVLPTLVHAAPVERSVRTRVPVDGIATNTCGGEDVAFSGHALIKNQVSIDAAGGVHLKQQLTGQGVQGQGLKTGALYQYPLNSNYIFNGKLDTGGAFEGTFTSSAKLIGQGPSNNAVVRLVGHLTLNANGDITANIERFETLCGG